MTSSTTPRHVEFEREAGSQRSAVLLDRPARWFAGSAYVVEPVIVVLPHGSGSRAWLGPPGNGNATSMDDLDQPKAADARQGPILVVDDEPSILETIKEILESEGYPVALAANGLEALRAIERERPSLIILDMRMPVLDGWGFAREMHERNITVPVLVMTAAQDARRWADEIDADDYLAKPFNLIDLLGAIERLREGGEAR